MKFQAILVVAVAILSGCRGWFAPATESTVETASFGGNEIVLDLVSPSYEVKRGGVTVVGKTPFSVTVGGERLAAQKGALKSRKAGEGTLDTPVYKKASIDLASETIEVDYGAYAVKATARADGVAYRIVLKKGGTIDAEEASVTIPAGAECWFNRTNHYGCEETLPEYAKVGELPDDAKKFYYLPFVYKTQGKVVAVSESDVRSYPFWNLEKPRTLADGSVRLSAKFEGYPALTKYDDGKAKTDVPGGRWVRVVDHERFIARADDARELPWRTFSLGDSFAALPASDLVYALAPEKIPGDFSWVKPGKVAWDWWNAFDNKGDPEGCTTETYRRFIDFAAANGVEYVIFDEGWSEKLNIWKFSPVVDVPALIKYANEKGVGIILWMAWAQIYNNEDQVAEHFAELGAKGFKVDFMDRADAAVTDFLEKFAKACANNRMIVDYHGVARPTGLERRYPNIVNYEGIHGLEQMKWFNNVDDMMFNDVAAAYLRMSAGPMDYTPGAMINLPIGRHKRDRCRPASIGTRSRQMAMMSLYFAPLQMLADSPTNYEANMESFRFMAEVPTVWNDTIGLKGSPSTAAAVARETKDGDWYVAAIGCKEAMDYPLDLSFLPKGAWKTEIFRDAPDAAEAPEHYIHETFKLPSDGRVVVPLAPGGGFILKLTK